jgi:hypothetical protein
MKFTKLLNRKVFDRIGSAISNVARKNMSVLSRSNVHLVWQYPGCSLNFINQIVIDWVRSGNTVLIVASNMDEVFVHLSALGFNVVKVTVKT